MKVLVSADIEGVAGITDWTEAELHHPANAEFRERMTAEVVAACEGALEAGATELLVRDAHGTARNLLAERLPREASLVRGWGGDPIDMVEGVDGTFAAAVLVGWHAAGGSGGNPLAHTLRWSRLNGIRVNGELVAELHLSAWACALSGVPVAFVSGDEEICAAARRLDPAIQTVATGYGRGATSVSIHPAVARDAIRAGVRTALAGDLARISTALPDRFEVEVLHKDAREAYRVSFYPGARLADPTTVAFEAGDAYEMLRALRFLL